MSSKQGEIQAEKSPPASSGAAHVGKGDDVPIGMSASQRTSASLDWQQSAQHAPFDSPALNTSHNPPLRDTSLGASAADASASSAMNPDHAQQPSPEANTEANTQTSSLAGASGPSAVATAAVNATTAPPKMIQETAETSRDSAPPESRSATPHAGDETELAAPSKGELLQDMLTNK
jgi:hypothetical protein